MVEAFQFKMLTAMRRIFHIIIYRLTTLMVIIGCDDKVKETVNDSEVQQEVTISTPYTKSDGELVALIDNSLSSYFIYRGEPKGFEYEVLTLFAEDHGLKLRLKIIHDKDYILDSLNAGKGDLAAANLTINEARQEIIDFTNPLFSTRQVLIQRLPDNRRNLTADQINKQLIRNPLELAGKAITVRQNTSYFERLQNLSDETGINIKIDIAPNYLVIDNLIEMVSEGKIGYTVCDENLAKLICPSFNNLDYKTPISFPQNIGWAVRKTSFQLLDTLNQWLEKKKGSKEFNIVYDKYFEVSSKTRRNIRKNFDQISGKNISEYDKDIIKYANNINWDWKLLAAQVFKESNFNPQTKSWAGAIGLMQVMPNTAKEYGASTNDLYNPEINLNIGTKYLVWLEDQWKEMIMDSTELLKFTLASYNVGHGHVSDARRMAQSNGMNPNKWDDSVEQMLLLKMKPEYYNRPEVKYGYCRGIDPVNYVKDIFDYYELYSTLE